VSVEEYPSRPESVEEIREAVSREAKRYDKIFQDARVLAAENGLKIEAHVMRGYPVPIIVELANALRADLIVIGATSHGNLYENIIESHTHNIVQLAPCSVLIVK
jgi:nucleotide-binding universal stress UspA family protein